MRNPSRLRGAFYGTLAASGLIAGCDFQPTSAPMRFALNASTVEDLEFDPAAQDQIRGALEMLFGTPQNPRYIRLSDWVDDDYDPNWPIYPEDDFGSGEIDEGTAEALYADNERRFRGELAAIEEGRYGDVRHQISAPGLNLSWDDLRAAFDAEELTEDEFREEASALFASYYPSLVDSAELYRQQCLHCHGVEGGGDGPTAGSKETPFLDPLPRDYRRGIFKYTAVKDKARPRREDIYTVLDQGIYFTAMPSFRRFSIAERQGLVDYVRLLAIRGEVEHRLSAAVADEEDLTPTLVTETFQEVWEKWQEAYGKVVNFDGEIPPPTPERIERGREIYADAARGACVQCHGETGLGDGPGAWKVDDDGKHVPAYEDDWGHPIVPRNLQQGIYRFGRRPIDIYRRIYAGINGGPMPAIGESNDAEGNRLLSSDDLWSVVHYVRSLSEGRPDLIGSDGQVHAAAGGHDDSHNDTDDHATGAGH